MKIETKYNIGQEVWFITHEGPDGAYETIPLERGIITEVSARKYTDSTEIKYDIKLPGLKHLITCWESEIIPTIGDLAELFHSKITGREPCNRCGDAGNWQPLTYQEFVERVGDLMNEAIDLLKQGNPMTLEQAFQKLSRG